MFTYNLLGLYCEACGLISAHCVRQIHIFHSSVQKLDSSVVLLFASQLNPFNALLWISLKNLGLFIKVLQMVKIMIRYTKPFVFQLSKCIYTILPKHHTKLHSIIHSNQKCFAQHEIFSIVEVCNANWHVYWLEWNQERFAKRKIAKLDLCKNVLVLFK